jgi:hypothetical protein
MELLSRYEYSIHIRMTSIYPVFERTSKDTLHALLRRDWFVDDEAIYEELEWADQEAWDYVYANRETYSARVRECIEPTRYPVKMRVVDLTDAELRKMELQRKLDLERAFDEMWERVKNTVPERPYNDTDAYLDDAWTRVTAAKKVYCPPGRENKALREAENEYVRLRKKVEAEDAEYIAQYKDDLKLTWMRGVQEENVNEHSM